MKMFKGLIVCLLSGSVFAAALPTNSQTEETVVSTLVVPSETPGPDAPFPTAAQQTAKGNFIPHCDNCTGLAALDSMWWNEMSWNLSPVRGTSFLAIYSNGDVRFKTWFRNSNRWVTYRYAIACVFRDAPTGQPAHVFETSRTRQLGGTAVGGPGSTHEIDATWNNPLIATHWNNIRAGDGLLHCTASRSFDVADLLSQLIETAIKYGPIIGAILL
ncbi:hypothetical protein BKA66DRAFT_582936 [Pyrenochaeta sp. MPI-SDFR-AT-0127]|nr:hypothetical protein BKA66DRAFT_582936 [Pyrenochaeta sp. MPI-SDFR-AT-0127]